MLAQEFREFYWLVRREFWEHRSFFIVPTVILGIISLTAIVAWIRGAEHLGMGREVIRYSDNVDPAAFKLLVEGVFVGVGSLFAIAMTIVTVFYLLGSLYTERRDRSVLFWKSLPVSDTSTVLSKLFTAVVAIPVISVIGTAFAYLVIAFLMSLIFGFSEGFPFGALWNPLTIVGTMLKSLGLTFSVYLWFLPVFAWLLFCSSFARRTVILFAIFIPAGIILAEHLATNHSYLGNTIGAYFIRFGELFIDGFAEMGDIGAQFFDGRVTIQGGLPVAGQFFRIFTEPYFYIGLAVATAFTVAAIWWRRNRIDYG